MPFLMAGGLALGVRRRQKAFYSHAQQRVLSPIGMQRAELSSGQARGDLFSWLYCVKPVEVALGEKKLRVYLCYDALSQHVQGVEIQVFEIGRYLGKPRWVAVLEKAAAQRGKTLQEVA